MTGAKRSLVVGRFDAGEVPLASMHPHLLPVLLSSDVNGAVLSIGLEVRSLIRDQVAASNQLAQPFQRFAQREYIAGEHRFSSAAFRENREYSIGITLRARVFPCAECVDRYFRRFRVLDGLLQAAVARIVFA